MTKHQILNLDYINFKNQDLINKCEEILIELLAKEIYSPEEISFLNIYLSLKFANKENVDLHIVNMNDQKYIEKFQSTPFSDQTKAIKKYYEIIGQTKKIKEEGKSKYICTFHIDNYYYINSRAYTLMIIFHELQHIIQNNKEQINNKMIKFEDYIVYYENLIMKHDYDFYENNHDTFFKEKDANTYAILKTIELLIQNNKKLNLLDKNVLAYQTQKIFSRNILKDRIKISEKAKEVIEQYSNFSIWPAYEIEFNITYQNGNKKLQRKTIKQILKEIKPKIGIEKHYTYKNHYQIDEKLFDCIIMNSIYNDNNFDYHLETLSKEEQQIILNSLKRSEKNILEYEHIIKNKLKQNYQSTKEYIDIITESEKRSNYLMILLKILNIKIHQPIFPKKELSKIKNKI